MSEHVSEGLWEAFWAKTLPAPELVRVAKHHSKCGQCRAIAHEIFMRRRNYAPIVIDLSDETWFKDDHLDLYENDLISAYVVGELDEDDRGWIDAHLRNCVRCLDKIRQAADHRL
ncbi:MAG: zf-HC2 domain-containing protein [Acidobacteria bacterium]|nr:zf-HC2 domain-containing protein [Acidobacteriota bacterium]